MCGSTGLSESIGWRSSSGRLKLYLGYMASTMHIDGATRTISVHFIATFRRNSVRKTPKERIAAKNTVGTTIAMYPLSSDPLSRYYRRQFRNS